MTFKSSREKLILRTQALLGEHLERLTWSKDQLHDFQLMRLKNILHLAKEKSTWYAQKLKDLDISQFKLSQLNTLPTLNKLDVMNHWDELITVSDLTKKQAEAHLLALRKDASLNPYFLDQYLFIATGGSSGVRGLFIWDENFLSETACLNYRYLIHDRIKNKLSLNTKLATIEAPTFLHGSQHLFTINVLPTITVLPLNVVQTVDKNIQQLNAFQPDFLVGFANYINELSFAQRENKLHISPTWISTNSEPLDDEMRDNIHKAWGIQPCNSWGSVEIGSVAMEDELHEGMILGEDGVLLELVDEHLRPVNSLADTKKILATSLINQSMPLIRYVIDDVLDIAHFSKSFPAYRTIQSILGRATDWFQYGNIKIAPIAFRDILALSKEVEEYQVIQTKEGAHFKLLCEGEPDIQEIKERTESNLKKAGLIHPVITIEIVKALPKHPETGKIKRFVPLVEN